MISVILANIIDFLAAMVQIYSGTAKSKGRILLLQTLQIGMQTVSMILLGAVTGAINNVLSCIRNLICYKEKLTIPVKLILIALSLFLTIRYNNQGLLGYLPFTVCTIYILLMNLKDPIAFKILVTATFVPWVFYYLVIRSYTGAFFAAATIVSNLVTIFRMKKEQKKEA